jgi:hypothetical protein
MENDSCASQHGTAMPEAQNKIDADSVLGSFRRLRDVMYQLEYQMVKVEQTLASASLPSRPSGR